MLRARATERTMPVRLASSLFLPVGFVRCDKNETADSESQRSYWSLDLTAVRTVPGAPVAASALFLHRRTAGASAAASLPPLPNDAAHRPHKPEGNQGEQQIIQRLHSMASVTGASRSERPALRRSRPRRTAWPPRRPSAMSSGARAGWSQWLRHRAYTAG